MSTFLDILMRVMLITQLEQPVSTDLLGGVCVPQLPEQHGTGSNSGNLKCSRWQPLTALNRCWKPSDHLVKQLDVFQDTRHQYIPFPGGLKGFKMFSYSLRTTLCEAILSEEQH